MLIGKIDARFATGPREAPEARGRSRPSSTPRSQRGAERARHVARRDACRGPGGDGAAVADLRPIDATIRVRVSRSPTLPTPGSRSTPSGSGEPPEAKLEVFEEHARSDRSPRTTAPTSASASASIRTGDASMRAPTAMPARATSTWASAPERTSSGRSSSRSTRPSACARSCRAGRGRARRSASRATPTATSRSKRLRPDAEVPGGLRRLPESRRHHHEGRAHPAGLGRPRADVAGDSGVGDASRSRLQTTPSLGRSSPERRRPRSASRPCGSSRRPGCASASRSRRRSPA